MSLFAGLATIAGAGLGLLGNAKAASAAKSAANATRDNSAQIAQIARTSGDAQAQAIREGTDAATDIYGRNYAAGAPGVTALHEELNRPEVGNDINLTPFQQQQLDDIRRRTENSLAGSGFRGSGRARVSAMRAVEGDARNRFLEANRANNRQERQFAQNAKRGVAGTLASGAFGANNATAAANLSEGRSLADIERGTANLQVRGLEQQSAAGERQANVAANRSIADAAIGANAIGDLAGAFDPGLRKSRYSTGQTTSAMRGYYGI